MIENKYTGGLATRRRFGRWYSPVWDALGSFDPLLFPFIRFRGLKSLNWFEKISIVSESGEISTHIIFLANIELLLPLVET